MYSGKWLKFGFYNACSWSVIATIFSIANRNIFVNDYDLWFHAISFSKTCSAVIMTFVNTNLSLSDSNEVSLSWQACELENEYVLNCNPKQNRTSTCLPTCDPVETTLHYGIRVGTVTYQRVSRELPPACSWHIHESSKRHQTIAKQKRHGNSQCTYLILDVLRPDSHRKGRSQKKTEWWRFQTNSLYYLQY